MPKVICLRHRALSRLFLFALSSRNARQMVVVGLDRHGLPRFLLRRTVLGIERLFPRRQLAAVFFQLCHLGQLLTARQRSHRGLGRPAVRRLRLMLGKVFPAVLGGELGILGDSVFSRCKSVISESDYKFF